MIVVAIHVGTKLRCSLISEMDHTEKNSVRGYVFRFTLELIHCLMRSLRVSIGPTADRWLLMRKGGAHMIARRASPIHSVGINAW